jgi:integrase
MQTVSENPAPKLKAPALPQDANIWIGWSHLFTPEPFRDLAKSHITETALKVGEIPATHLWLFEYIYLTSPQILSAVGLNKFYVVPVVLDALLATIRDLAPPKRGFAISRRFLEVIEAGNNAERFDITIPHLPIPMFDDPASPFIHKNMECLAKVHPLITAFHQSLEDNSGLSLHAQWGRVMLSAMINGALTQTSFLRALPEALITAEPNLRWLVLLPSDGKKDSGPIVPRRWFPDPLTRLLLANMRSTPLIEISDLGRRQSDQIYFLILAYAKESGFGLLLPTTIGKILLGLKTRLHLHLPSWLVSYANNDFSSVSLPDWVWDRLNNSPTQRVEKLTKRPSLGPERQPREEHGDPQENDVQDKATWPFQLRSLGSAILANEDDLLKRVGHWQKEDALNRLPSVSLLGEWLSEHVLKKVRGRHPLHKHTVYNNLNCIGGRLVGQLGKMDFTQLGSETAYIEIYRNALDNTPSIGTRRTVAHSLKSLHEFLVKKYNVAEIDESGIFNVSGASQGMVDANIVSVDTFYRAMQYLRSDSKKRVGDRVSDQLVRIAELGFFGGLRRSEAVGLTLGDLEVVAKDLTKVLLPDAWLEVADNELRNLKTKAGHRLLPLTILAPEGVLTRLLKWHSNRIKEEAGNLGAHLFPDFVKNGQANPKDPRLDIITNALQKMADDETLRFHHLRHSFATRLAFEIWLADQPLERNYLPKWFMPAKHNLKRFKPPTLKNLRRGLLGDAPTNRRSMLQVSLMMGHTDLIITMGSYIHLSDFILGRMAYRIAPKLSEKALYALSNYSETHITLLSKKIDKYQNSQYINGELLDRIADRVVLRGAHAVRPLETPSIDYQVSTPTISPKGGLERLQHIANALNSLTGTFVGNDQRFDQVAFEFGLSKAELEKWFSKKKELPATLFNLNPTSIKSSQLPRGEIDLLAGDAHIFFAKKTFQVLSALYSKRANDSGRDLTTQKHVRDFLKTYPEIADSGSYLSIQTSSLADAKKWLWFINEMGMSQAVVINHDSTKVANSSSQKIQIAYWKKGLNCEQITDSGATTLEAARGRVQIDLKLSAMTNSKEKYTKVTALYGVRFVLTMLLVVGPSAILEG